MVDQDQDQDHMIMSDLLFNILLSKIPFLSKDNNTIRLDVEMFIKIFTSMGQNVTHNIIDQIITNKNSTYLMNHFTLDHMIYDNMLDNNKLDDNTLDDNTSNELTLRDHMIEKMMTNILKIDIINKLTNNLNTFGLDQAETWGIDNIYDLGNKIKKCICTSIKNNKCVFTELSSFYYETLMNHNKISDSEQFNIPNTILIKIVDVIKKNNGFKIFFDCFDIIFSEFSDNLHKIKNKIENKLEKIIFFTLWDIKIRGNDIKYFVPDNNIINAIIATINSNYQNIIINSFIAVQKYNDGEYIDPVDIFNNNNIILKFNLLFSKLQFEDIDIKTFRDIFCGIIEKFLESRHIVYKMDDEKININEEFIKYIYEQFKMKKISFYTSI